MFLHCCCFHLKINFVENPVVLLLCIILIVEFLWEVGCIMGINKFHELHLPYYHLTIMRYFQHVYELLLPSSLDTFSNAVDLKGKRKTLSTILMYVGQGKDRY